MGLSIVLLVIWLAGEMVGFGIACLYARRRSRYIFERRLRRNGLPEDVIAEIARRYHPPGLIRSLIRAASS